MVDINTSDPQKPPIEALGISELVGMTEKESTEYLNAVAKIIDDFEDARRKTPCHTPQWMYSLQGIVRNKNEVAHRRKVIKVIAEYKVGDQMVLIGDSKMVQPIKLMKLDTRQDGYIFHSASRAVEVEIVSINVDDGIYRVKSVHSSSEYIGTLDNDWTLVFRRLYKK